MKKLLNSMQLRNTIKNGDRLEIRNNRGTFLVAGIVSNKWADGRMLVGGGDRRWNLTTWGSLTKYKVELVTEFKDIYKPVDSRTKLLTKEKQLTDNITVNENKMKQLQIEYTLIQDSVKSDKDKLKIIKQQLKTRFITAGDFIHNLDETLELIKGKTLTDDLTGIRIHSIDGLNFEKNRINYTRSVVMTAGRTTRIKVG